MKPNLKAFLVSSAGLMTDPFIRTTRIVIFLRQRYDVMGEMFPHPPFSVNEATPDFFAQTLDYLINGIPDCRPGSDPKNARHDIYWQRYRAWVHYYQS